MHSDFANIRGFEYVSRVCADGCEYFPLPQRSTKHSAGYDFFAPEDITIPTHEFSHTNNPQIVKPFCIKSGVKAYMQDDEVLEVFVRSSAPSKLGLVMANSVGIIDSDYYGNKENEGEIGFLVYNLSGQPIDIKRGEKIGQGIFTSFLTADDEVEIDCEREGGFGSTGV